MRKIENDIDVLSLEQKKAILADIKQEELLGLFKDFKVNYKPIERRQTPLDQRIAVGITSEERDKLSKEISELRKSKSIQSASALIRHRALSEIDVEEWRERAILGLNELSKSSWDKRALTRQLNRSIKLLENIDDDEEGKEDIYMYTKEIESIEKRIKELSRPSIRRGYRVSGRVTLNEANHIRWRAARLNITVADYMRFVIFGHRPFSEADRHLSMDAKRRFYVSIIDVANNGWGVPPKVEECANCVRYEKEIKELRSKLERLQNLAK